MCIAFLNFLVYICVCLHLLICQLSAFVHKLYYFVLAWCDYMAKLFFRQSLLKTFSHEMLCN